MKSSKTKNEKQLKGYMTIEEGYQRTLEIINKLYDKVEKKRRKDFPILTSAGKRNSLKIVQAMDEEQKKERLQSLTESVFLKVAKEINLSFEEFYCKEGKERYINLFLESIYRADADKIIFYGDLKVTRRKLKKGYIIYNVGNKSFHTGILTPEQTIESDMKLAPDESEENLSPTDKLLEYILTFLCIEAGYKVKVHK